MKRLLDALTNKWVLGIIGLVALSLLIWFGADFIKFGSNNATLSPSLRIVIIGILVLVWFTWNLSQWLIERKQNQAFLKDIEEAEKQEAVNPDEERSKEELDAISSRFKEALSTLKKSRFKSRSGSKSLYQLPWYIIIGPPGSGKTTALVNSGLEFPLSQSHGKEALGGIGGTRNCDWWFTNEAVMIDTAGRYTTQDSHRIIDNSAWNGFLSLLKKYRRRRPINGAIVAISLQDLMVQTSEQRIQQAKTIRSRINELQKQLGIRFPIYLTFTKCDLVAGFSEFFANLSHAEREQVWGLSFPPEQNAQTGVDIEIFENEFDQLIERLNQRLLWRVQQERNIEKRSILQGFPARMDSLGSIVNDFLKQAFSPNRYDIVPMLRGVYFSSATQEGSPIDRMIASVSVDFGLNRDLSKQQHNSGKSFFITRLLKDVIFAESELVGVNRKVEKFTVWLRRATFGALATLFLGCIILWSGSVTQNKIYMGDVNEQLEQHITASNQFNYDENNITQTLSVLNPLREASRVYDQENHPWLSNLGLYDSGVDKAADALYRDKLETIFLPTFVRSIELHLNSLSGKDESLLPLLRMYLTFFDAEKRESLSDIKTYAQTQWQNQLPGQANKQDQLLVHLDALLEQPLPKSAKVNTRIVSRARTQLKRIPVAQRLYNQLITDEQNSHVVDLYSKIGGDMRQIFSLQETSSVFSMPYIFTKEGFKNTTFGAQSPLLKQLAKDQWIYGEDTQNEDFSEADLEKLSRDVKQIYLTEYAKNWQSFLKSFSIAGFENTAQALEMLNQLSDPIYSPLLAIVELATDNTELTPRRDLAIPTNKTGIRAPVSGTTRKAASAAGDLAQNLAGDLYQPNSVDLRFENLQRMVKSEQGRPAQIQNHLENIQKLHEYLTEIDTAPNPNASAYDAAKSRFSGAGNDAIKQLRLKANTAPEPIKAWLLSLADHTWALVMNKTRSHVQYQWEDQVYRSYANTLANKYPLSAGKDSETPILEFDNFFKPQGIQQNFVNEYIAPFINTRNWKQKVFDKQSLGLSPSTMVQLRRAENIRNAFYSTGESASIDFKVEPSKLDSGVRLFALEVGETRTSYSHGPRTTKNISWSGLEDIRVRIIFEDLNETVHRKHFEGDWALIRLLDTSKVETGRNRNTHLVTFEDSGRKAQYTVSTSTRINPFDLTLLRNYRLAKTL